MVTVGEGGTPASLGLGSQKTEVAADGVLAQVNPRPARLRVPSPGVAGLMVSAV